MRIEYKPLRDNEPYIPPKRQFDSDAGLDLTVSRDVVIFGYQRAMLPTNLALAIPEGHFGLVLPRSSAFYKRGLLVHQGIIDAGFRGEVMVLAFNPHKSKTIVKMGERIAQMLLLPVVDCELARVEELPESERGEQGFGSTGGFSKHTQRVLQERNAKLKGKKLS